MSAQTGISDKKAKRVLEISEFMQDKNTDELLGIWVENDRRVYLEEAFIAVEQILTNRGVSIPQQQPPKMKAKGLEQFTESAKDNEIKTWGVFLIIYGIISLIRQEHPAFGAVFFILGALSFFLPHRNLYLLYGSWSLLAGGFLFLVNRNGSSGLILFVLQLIWALYLFFKFFWYGLSQDRKDKLIERFRR
jgi:hypothetical protein